MASRQATKARARQVDPNKKLHLRSVEDIPDDHDKKQKGKVPAKFDQHIPTPPIRQIESHEKKVVSPYKPPSHYVKFHQNSGALNRHSGIFYDILEEDKQWLQHFNRNRRDGIPEITEYIFETCIEIMEQFMYENTYPELAVIDPHDSTRVRFRVDEARALCAHSNILHEHTTAIYQYWRDKRRTWGKALMRFYQAPPAPENPSPQVAFRPRAQGRRASSRHSRRNDALGYQKMRSLRVNLHACFSLVEQCKIRELFRRQLVLHDAEYFQMVLSETKIGKLMQTYPNPTGDADIPWSGQQQSNGPIVDHRQKDNAIILGDDAFFTPIPSTMNEIRKLFDSAYPKCEYGIPGSTLPTIRIGAHARAKKKIPLAVQRQFQGQNKRTLPSEGGAVQMQALQRISTMIGSESDELSEEDDDIIALQQIQHLSGEYSGFAQLHDQLSITKQKQANYYQYLSARRLKRQQYLYQQYTIERNQFILSHLQQTYTRQALVNHFARPAIEIYIDDTDDVVDVVDYNIYGVKKPVRANPRILWSQPPSLMGEAPSSSQLHVISYDRNSQTMKRYVRLYNTPTLPLLQQHSSYNTISTDNPELEIDPDQQPDQDHEREHDQDRDHDQDQDQDQDHHDQEQDQDPEPELEPEGDDDSMPGSTRTRSRKVTFLEDESSNGVPDAPPRPKRGRPPSSSTAAAAAASSTPRRSARRLQQRDQADVDQTDEDHSVDQAAEPTRRRRSTRGAKSTTDDDLLPPSQPTKKRTRGMASKSSGGADHMSSPLSPDSDSNANDGTIFPSPSEDGDTLPQTKRTRLKHEADDNSMIQIKMEQHDSQTDMVLPVAETEHASTKAEPHTSGLQRAASEVDLDTDPKIEVSTYGSLILSTTDQRFKLNHNLLTRALGRLEAVKRRKEADNLRTYLQKYMEYRFALNKHQQENAMGDVPPPTPPQPPELLAIRAIEQEAHEEAQMASIFDPNRGNQSLSGDARLTILGQTSSLAAAYHKAQHLSKLIADKPLDEALKIAMSGGLTDDKFHDDSRLLALSGSRCRWVSAPEGPEDDPHESLHRQLSIHFSDDNEYYYQDYFPDVADQSNDASLDLVLFHYLRILLRIVKRHREEMNARLLRVPILKQGITPHRLKQHYDSLVRPSYQLAPVSAGASRSDSTATATSTQQSSSQLKTHRKPLPNHLHNYFSNFINVLTSNYFEQLMSASPILTKGSSHDNLYDLSTVTKIDPQLIKALGAQSEPSQPQSQPQPFAAPQVSPEQQLYSEQGHIPHDPSQSSSQLPLQTSTTQQTPSQQAQPQTSQQTVTVEDFRKRQYMAMQLIKLYNIYRRMELLQKDDQYYLLETVQNLLEQCTVEKEKILSRAELDPEATHSWMLHSNKIFYLQQLYRELSAEQPIQPMDILEAILRNRYGDEAVADPIGVATSLHQPEKQELGQQESQEQAQSADQVSSNTTAHSKKLNLVNVLYVELKGAIHRQKRQADKARQQTVLEPFHAVSEHTQKDKSAASEPEQADVLLPSPSVLKHESSTKSETYTVKHEQNDPVLHSSLPSLPSSSASSPSASIIDKMYTKYQLDVERAPIHPVAGDIICDPSTLGSTKILNGAVGALQSNHHLLQGLVLLHQKQQQLQKYAQYTKYNNNYMGEEQSFVESALADGSSLFDNRYDGISGDINQPISGMGSHSTASVTPPEAELEPSEETKAALESIIQLDLQHYPKEQSFDDHGDHPDPNSLDNVEIDFNRFLSDNDSDNDDDIYASNSRESSLTNKVPELEKIEPKTLQPYPYSQPVDKAQSAQDCSRHYDFYNKPYSHVRRYRSIHDIVEEVMSLREKNSLPSTSTSSSQVQESTVKQEQEHARVIPQSTSDRERIRKRRIASRKLIFKHLSSIVDEQYLLQENMVSPKEFQQHLTTKTAETSSSTSTSSTSSTTAPGAPDATTASVGPSTSTSLSAHKWGDNYSYPVDHSLQEVKQDQPPSTETVQKSTMMVDAQEKTSQHVLAGPEAPDTILSDTMNTGIIPVKKQNLPSDLEIYGDSVPSGIMFEPVLKSLDGEALPSLQHQLQNHLQYSLRYRTYEELISSSALLRKRQFESSVSDNTDVAKFHRLQESIQKSVRDLKTIQSCKQQRLYDPITLEQLPSAPQNQPGQFAIVSLRLPELHQIPEIPANGSEQQHQPQVKIQDSTSAAHVAVHPSNDTQIKLESGTMGDDPLPAHESKVPVADQMTDSTESTTTSSSEATKSGDESSGAPTTTTAEPIKTDETYVEVDISDISSYSTLNPTATDSSMSDTSDTIHVSTPGAISLTVPAPPLPESMISRFDHRQELVQILLEDHRLQYIAKHFHIDTLWSDDEDDDEDDEDGERQSTDNSQSQLFSSPLVNESSYPQAKFDINAFAKLTPVDLGTQITFDFINNYHFHQSQLIFGPISKLTYREVFADPLYFHGHLDHYHLYNVLTVLSSSTQYDVVSSRRPLILPHIHQLLRSPQQFFHDDIELLSHVHLDDVHQIIFPLHRAPPQERQRVDRLAKQARNKIAKFISNFDADLLESLESLPAEDKSSVSRSIRAFSNLLPTHTQVAPLLEGNGFTPASHLLPGLFGLENDVTLETSAAKGHDLVALAAMQWSQRKEILRSFEDDTPEEFFQQLGTVDSLHLLLGSDFSPSDIDQVTLVSMNVEKDEHGKWVHKLSVDAECDDTFMEFIQMLDNRYVTTIHITDISDVDSFEEFYRLSTDELTALARELQTSLPLDVASDELAGLGSLTFNLDHFPSSMYFSSSLKQSELVRSAIQQQHAHFQAYLTSPSVVDFEQNLFTLINPLVPTPPLPRAQALKVDPSTIRSSGMKQTQSGRQGALVSTDGSAPSHTAMATLGGFDSNPSQGQSFHQQQQPPVQLPAVIPSDGAAFGINFHNLCFPSHFYGNLHESLSLDRLYNYYSLLNHSLVSGQLLHSLEQGYRGSTMPVYSLLNTAYKYQQPAPSLHHRSQLEEMQTQHQWEHHLYQLKQQQYQCTVQETDIKSKLAQIHSRSPQDYAENPAYIQLSQQLQTVLAQKAHVDQLIQHHRSQNHRHASNNHAQVISFIESLYSLHDFTPVTFSPPHVALDLVPSSNSLPVGLFGRTQRQSGASGSSTSTFGGSTQGGSSTSSFRGNVNDQQKIQPPPVFPVPRPPGSTNSMIIENNKDVFQPSLMVSSTTLVPITAASASLPGSSSSMSTMDSTTDPTAAVNLTSAPSNLSVQNNFPATIMQSFQFDPLLPIPNDPKSVRPISDESASYLSAAQQAFILQNQHVPAPQVTTPESAGNAVLNHATRMGISISDPSPSVDYLLQESAYQQRVHGYNENMRHAAYSGSEIRFNHQRILHNVRHATLLSPLNNQAHMGMFSTFNVMNILRNDILHNHYYRYLYAVNCEDVVHRLNLNIDPSQLPKSPSSVVAVPPLATVGGDGPNPALKNELAQYPIPATNSLTTVEPVLAQGRTSVRVGRNNRLMVEQIVLSNDIPIPVPKVKPTLQADLAIVEDTLLQISRTKASQQPSK